MPFVFYSVLIMIFLWVMSYYRHTPVLSSGELMAIDRYLEIEKRINRISTDEKAQRNENKQKKIANIDEAKTFSSIQYPKLYIEEQGEEVSYLQSLLNIKVDGVFGMETHEKVIEFQKNNGLVPDGIVGESTWEKLIEVSQEKSAFVE